MKKLRQYQVFDVKGFLADKQVIVGSVKPATAQKDLDNGYGFILKLMIIADPNNEEVNQGESLTIKLKEAPNGVKVGSSFTFGKQLNLRHATGSVYGDYQNQLSIKADSLVKAQPGA